MQTGAVCVLYGPAMTESREIEALRRDLALLGLILFGVVETGPPSPSARDGRTGNRAALIGNAGPAMWRRFQADASADGGPDPLDRWTRAAVMPVADRHGISVVFPFDGPPYWPFVTWAMALPGISQSPFGPLVHTEYGPWFAFRAALIWTDETPLAADEPQPGPCVTCREKPCLDACPAGAITRETAYDVVRCREHVATAQDRRCAETGCLARHACPVGCDYVYEPAQAAFHMASFAPPLAR